MQLRNFEVCLLSFVQSHQELRSQQNGSEKSGKEKLTRFDQNKKKWFFLKKTIYSQTCVNSHL
jgi:hypothetical protein